MQPVNLYHGLSSEFVMDVRQPLAFFFFKKLFVVHVRHKVLAKMCIFGSGHHPLKFPSHKISIVHSVCIVTVSLSILSDQE